MRVSCVQHTQAPGKKGRRKVSKFNSDQTKSLWMEKDAVSRLSQVTIK